MSSFTFMYDKSLRRVRVDSDSSSLYGSLLEVYTVQNPSYFFERQKGIDRASEFLSVISPTGTFRPGLFIPIYKTTLGLVGGDKGRISIDEDSRKAIAEICKPLDGVFVDGFEVRQLDRNRPLRYYQTDAIKQLLKYGTGICVSPTGSGKSYIMATLIDELVRSSGRIPNFSSRPRIVVVVPTRQLVDQMYKDFREYGLSDVCRWTSNSGRKRDSTYEDNSCSDGFARIVITNHKWICDHIGAKGCGFPVKEVGCVLADEVHTVRHQTKILRCIEKMAPRLRFGFTGTLPKNPFDRWVVIGTFGIPVYMAEVKRFQDEGFLSKIEIHPIRGVVKELEGNRKLLYSINHELKLGDVMPDGTVVDTSLPFRMEHEFFDANCRELYGPMFERISELFDIKGRNMIVLFDRISIGKAIHSLLSERFSPEGVKVHYVDGSIDVSDRENVRDALERGSGNILVAQAITASVGLNIRNLNGIAFAFAGKSFIRVIQSIGRVIRLKDDGSKSKLFELYFNSRYSSQHHAEKMDILKEQYGADCVMKEEVVRI